VVILIRNIVRTTYCVPPDLFISNLCDLLSPCFDKNILLVPAPVLLATFKVNFTFWLIGKHTYCASEFDEHENIPVILFREMKKYYAFRNMVTFYVNKLNKFHQQRSKLNLI